MTCSELVKLLKKNSPSYFLKHGANHDIWFNPETQTKFTVPRHKSEEIANGTARNILKCAGYKE